MIKIHSIYKNIYRSRRITVCNSVSRSVWEDITFNIQNLTAEKLTSMIYRMQEHWVYND